MAELAPALVDIIGPSAPPPAVSEVASALPTLGLLLLAASLAVWWWRGRQRRRAVQQLKKLHQSFRSGALSGHDAAYQIASALRRQLKLVRLATGMPPRHLPEQDRANWDDFVQRLDQLRYPPGSAQEAATIDALFGQAQVWLRRYD
jgi:hypothetical protein